MSVRTDLAEYLVEQLPDEVWRVIPYAYHPDNIDAGRCVLTLWAASVRPGASLGLLTNTVTAWLLVPEEDPITVDDRLDPLLAQLLDVLDRHSALG